MEPIVIASGNRHKVEEMRTIFGGAGIEVVGLGDVAEGIEEPEETGATFEANAELKAVWYAKRLGRMCVADDSGLEVDALGGEPGVYSARYSGVDGERDVRDSANNEKLMREMEGVEDEERGARFVCAMVLAEGDDVVAVVRGTFEGRIGQRGDVPRGENGFGYDPIFLVAPHFERTSAELSSEEKNARSHRGEAARRMVEALRGRP